MQLCFEQHGTRATRQRTLRYFRFCLTSNSIGIFLHSFVVAVVVVIFACRHCVLQEFGDPYSIFFQVVYYGTLHNNRTLNKLYSLPEQSIVMMQCSTRQIAAADSGIRISDKMFAVQFRLVPRIAVRVRVMHRTSRCRAAGGCCCRGSGERLPHC